MSNAPRHFDAAAKHQITGQQVPAPQLPPKRVRDRQISITIPPQFAPDFFKRLEELGLPAGESIARGVLGLPIPQRANLKTEVALLWEFGKVEAAIRKIGVNFNQLVARANETGCIPEREVIEHFYALLLAQLQELKPK